MHTALNTNSSVLKGDIGNHFYQHFLFGEEKVLKIERKWMEGNYPRLKVFFFGREAKRSNLNTLFAFRSNIQKQIKKDFLLISSLSLHRWILMLVSNKTEHSSGTVKTIHLIRWSSQAGSSATRCPRETSEAPPTSFTTGTTMGSGGGTISPMA